MLAPGLLHAAQDSLSVVCKTDQVSVMKFLDSVIDWISDLGGETDSEHSGKFATILSGGVAVLVLLISV
jgi:hypothetical protein